MDNANGAHAGSEEGSKQGLALLKGLLLVAMIIGVLAAGLLPVRLLNKLRATAAQTKSSAGHKRVSLFLCLLTCFSGGVFLATCFLHLLPELSENTDEVIKTLKCSYNLDIHYPIAELLSCIGFFLLFFIEEVVIMWIPSIAHGHGHGHGHSHGDGGHAHNDDEDLEKREPSENGGPLLLAGGGGSVCCMTSLPTAIARASTDRQSAEPEGKSALSDGTEQPMLEDDEAEGHCSLHCPETAHYRRNSHGGMTKPACPEKCNEKLPAPVGFAEPEACEVNCEKVDEAPPIMMKSAPHAHSHGLRSITFLLAISIHELIEGMAFGVQDSPSKVTALFFSLLVHKLIVSFSIGLQLARTHAHQLHLVVISMVVLSLVSPLGAVFGIILDMSPMDDFVKSILITICQGIAVGTFLYVTFFEVLIHERDNEHPNLLKLLLMLIGFTLIGLLRLMDSHEHSHDHGHGIDKLDEHGCPVKLSETIGSVAQTFMANVTAPTGHEGHSH